MVRGPIRNHHAGDARQGGNFFRQPRKECLDGFCGAFHLNGNACLGVGNETRQVVFGGQPIDERAEPHALHDPRNFNGFAHKNSDE